MADGILGPVSVGLIEQMHAALPYDGARGTEPFLLVFQSRLWCYLANAFPVHQILAFGYADVPSLHAVPLPGWDGVVHQIASLVLHYLRVLGVRQSDTACIFEHHLLSAHRQLNQAGQYN